MFGSLLMPVSAPAHVGIGVSITVAPPAIPVYTQPDLSGSQLYLDTGLLGVGRRRLLLGARHVGGCPSGGTAVDSGLLGLG